MVGRVVQLYELGSGTGQYQEMPIRVTGVASGLYRIVLRSGAHRSLLPVMIVK